jgi:hypothetical protein
VTITARGELQQELQTELNVALERGAGAVRMLIVDDNPRAAPSVFSCFVVSSADGRGGENLLTHLNELDRYVDAMPWGDTPLEFVSDRDRRSFLERSRIARSSLEYLRTLAPVPPVSAGRPPLPPGRSCFRRQSFIAPDPADQRTTREICWRVALVGKAMSELWRRRDLADVPCLCRSRRCPPEG